MVMRLASFVSGGDTADQGNAVFEQLRSQRPDVSGLMISFAGISTVTSSFTNASFLKFAQTFGIDALRQLKITDASHQIREVLRDRVLNAKVLSNA